MGKKLLRKLHRSTTKANPWMTRPSWDKVDIHDAAPVSVAATTHAA